MRGQQPPPIQTDAVMALGRRARWLSWAYLLFVLYYLAITALVVRHGIRLSSAGGFANDVVRLANVLAPLFCYIVVNAAIAVSLWFFVAMHPVARWSVAAVAVVVAAVSVGSYGLALWEWAEAGQPGGFAKRQIFGLGVVAAYVILAAFVVMVTRRLHRYVRVDDVWLLRLSAH
jgi:hypothetical protein